MRQDAAWSPGQRVTDDPFPFLPFLNNRHRLTLLIADGPLAHVQVCSSVSVVLLSQMCVHGTQPMLVEL